MRQLACVVAVALLAGVTVAKECSRGRDCGRGFCCVQNGPQMRGKRDVDTTTSTPEVDTSTSSPEVDTPTSTPKGECQPVKALNETCYNSTNGIRVWKQSRRGLVAQCGCGRGLTCQAGDTQEIPYGYVGTCVSRRGGRKKSRPHKGGRKKNRGNKKGKNKKGGRKGKKGNRRKGGRRRQNKGEAPN